MTDYQWLPSPSASVVHLAACIAAGRSRLLPKLQSDIAAIRSELPSMVDIDPLLWTSWQRSTESKETTESADVMADCMKQLNANEQTRLSRIVAAASQLLERHFDQPREQLRLRCRPIREQWEARGPGLMHQIFRAGWLPAPDRVLFCPVLPIVGGYCRSITPDVVVVEAVLTQVHPSIPEVVRMAYAVARLIEPSDAKRQELLKLTLAAAEHVELLPPNQLSREQLAAAID